MKEINNDGACLSLCLSLCLSVYVGQALGPKCYTSAPAVAFPV